MPHPSRIKHEHGKVWHLEDEHLTKPHAEAIAQHLRNTEDKRAMIIKTPHGKEVWWSKRG